MKRRISISDIAKEIGVSPSTVSRALSDHPAISYKIKQEVKEIAFRLNYVPNSVAVNLKSGRTNLIGIIVPNISRNFFSLAIEGIEDIASTLNYSVIICHSKDSSVREKNLIQSLSGKVDGIIASLAAENNSHKYYNHLANINIPLVVFDRMDSRIDASTVTVNDFKGAVLAVNHLLEQGYRKIFHFAGMQNIGIWNNRHMGYLDAMATAGITPEQSWITIAPTTVENGEDFAKKIIESGDYPDAIFFSGDFAALGAMEVFKRAGLNIPMVGFANEMFCKIMSPALSSVEQFSYEMGKLACKKLFDLIEGKPIEHTVIEPELIIRESSLKR